MSDVNLANLPTQLANAFGIPLLAGQFLASLILLAFFMFPALFLCAKFNKDVVFPSLFIGFASIVMCIAIGWMPYWILLIIALITALMFAGQMRDWITGTNR